MILFCGGCLFSYTILIPVVLNVSIYVNVFMGIDLMRALDEYMSLLLWMVLGIGLNFQFPIVITILVYVGGYSPMTNSSNPEVTLLSG